MALVCLYSISKDEDCGSSLIRRYVTYGFDKPLRDDDVDDDNDNEIRFVPLNTRVRHRTTYRICQGRFWINAIAGLALQYFPKIICKKTTAVFHVKARYLL
jgi:hypothetical protein